MHEDNQRRIRVSRTPSWVLLFLLLSAIADAQSAQPTDETPYVVRFGTYGIEVWQFTGPDTGLERIWITRTVVSEEYAEEWAGRGLFGFHAPRGVVADLDNDGTSELITVDGFGILIYGTTNPQYIPFAEARTSDVYTKLLVVDLDNDGNKEIVVLPSGSGIRTAGQRTGNLRLAKG